MATNVRLRVACLLLLLFSGLASGSVLSSPTRQLEEDHHTWDTAAAKASLMPEIKRRSGRDTHLSICVFCCGCCGNSKCGFCCKT